MLRTAASLAGITAVFGLVLYLAYGSGGGDSAGSPTPSAIVRTTSTASPPASATASPAPRSVPLVLDGTDVGTLEVRSLVSFPRDLVLILETGCWQCDGPSTGLRRMYKDPNGEVRVEQLTAHEQLGLDIGDYFTGYAITPDASHMLASVCVRGACGVGLGGWSPDARTAVFESTDGGVTWQSDAEYDLGLSFEGIVSDGRALVSWQVDANDTRSYAWYPGLEPVSKPPGADFPATSVAGDLLWRSLSMPGRLVRGDGSVFVDLGERTDLRPSQLLQPRGDGTFVINWRWFPASDPGRDFLSLVNRSGAITSTYEINPSNASMVSAVWHDGQIYGTMANPPVIGAPPGFLGLLPAILDLGAVRYNNLKEPFLDDGYDPQRDIIRAVQSAPYTGSLARVVGVEGSCLNVRDAPDPDAAIVTCMADGVLLRAVSDDAGEVSVSGDWVWVYTPDGFLGWASTEYLEY